MAGEDAPDHHAGELEPGRELGTEVQPVLPVAPIPAQQTERTAPPLDVVIAGNDQHRRGLLERLGEHQGPLQLAVASPLGQVAGEDDDGFAFGGNRALEEVLTPYADRIAFAFCGHTHRANMNTWQGIRGYNVGADYSVKRLLRLEWPAGTVVAHDFKEETS